MHNGVLAKPATVSSGAHASITAMPTVAPVSISAAAATAHPNRRLLATAAIASSQTATPTVPTSTFVAALAAAD